MRTQEIQKYADVYGYNLIISELKKKFTHVSFREKSQPSEGALCLPVSRLKDQSDTKIIKVIIHNNNTITLITSFGWLWFSKL